MNTRNLFLLTLGLLGAVLGLVLIEGLAQLIHHLVH